MSVNPEVVEARDVGSEAFNFSDEFPCRDHKNQEQGDKDNEMQAQQEAQLIELQVRCV